MKLSFNNLLEVLDGFVPRQLVAPEAWTAIRTTAGRLAPIYRGGLECRLAPDNRRVDLHQCVRPDCKEPQLLSAHIRQSGWNRHRAWEQILHFCRQWQRRASSLHQAVSEVWLEFDIGSRRFNTPTPSIFLQLRPDESGNCIRQDLPDNLLAAMQPVTFRSELQKALKRCAAVCPAGARISHIGLMLGREQSPVRVNIKGLSARQWPQFLQDIDWPGSISRLSALVEPLYGRLDQLVFCLDVGRRTAPGVGLECLVDGGTNRRNAWADFLEELTEGGMCSPEKRSAVIAWEKIIKPPDAAHSWPENVILEAMARGPAVFSVISQAINHVKIAYHPNRPPEAKVYLWFSHLWATVEDVRSALAVTTAEAAGEASCES